MLSWLLDEQVSPQVASALAAPRANVPVASVYGWRSGELTGAADALVLEAAQDGLTLVTTDLKTIPPLLAEWGASGRSHGGVVFVDDRTISPADFGGLARSLVACWETRGGWDWTDRIVYLRPA